MDSKLKKEVHKEHCSPSHRQDLNNIDRYVNQPRKMISPFQAFSLADDGAQDGVHGYQLDCSYFLMQNTTWLSKVHLVNIIMLS